MDDPERGPTLQEQATHSVLSFMAASRESCWRKSILAGVVGVGMGVGVGTFLGTFEGAHGDLIGNTMREQLYNGFKKSIVAGYQRSVYFGKDFAVIGAMYSGIECVIERERARNDIMNPVIAGGITGGMVSGFSARKLGPRLLAAKASKGAAGFAVMAVVFEKAMVYFTQ